MKKTVALLLGVLLIIPVVSLCGCMESKEKPPTEEPTNKPTTGPTTTPKVVTIRTSGATFPKYQIQKWIAEYQKINPNVKIEYEGGGSGKGQKDFLQGLTHIGRTDPPVKKEMWDKFLKTGDQPLQFPEVVGAVVITYNVPEIGDHTLKLSRDVLVDIFFGNITYWDDERIKKLNPEVADKLPHKEIIVVHRSDDSGTTKIFTTFLSMVSEKWAKEVGSGKSVNWPVDKMGRGVGGKGNPGVINILKSTPYSIAYTELSYTIKNNLPTAAIENKEGKFIKPTTETIKAAVAGVKTYIPDPREGYKEKTEQLLDAPGEKAYPIVAFTHFLVWENKDHKHYTSEEAKAIKDFLRWVLTEGQKPENLAEGYVGLPKEVAEIGLRAVDMINE